MDNYFASDIAMSVYACMYVCLFVRSCISNSTNPNCFSRARRAICGRGYAGVAIVLPVLCMTLTFAHSSQACAIREQGTRYAQSDSSGPTAGCEVCHLRLLIVSAPIGERSIVMSVSVCVCVCCPQSYLRNYTSDLHQFLCLLPMAVTRSSSGGVVVIICYVLPVLRMTSYQLVSQGCSTSLPS